MKTTRTVLLSLLAALVAFPTFAADVSISGTVVAADDQRLILATQDGLRLYDLSPDLDRPASFGPDQVVLVHYQEGETPLVTSIAHIDERIEVLGRTDRETRAMLGTIVSTGRDHTIIRTPEGQQAFVIRPNRVHQGVLAPGEKVAMIYEVHEGEIDSKKYVATDIIKIEGFPASASAAAVKVRYTAAEATDASTTMAKLPAKDVASDDPAARRDTSATERDADRWGDRGTYSGAAAADRSALAGTETLPQTASQWVFVLLAGLGSLGLAMAIGFRA